MPREILYWEYDGEDKENLDMFEVGETVVDQEGDTWVRVMDDLGDLSWRCADNEDDVNRMAAQRLRGNTSDYVLNNYGPVRSEHGPKEWVTEANVKEAIDSIRKEIQ